ncbi:MAG: hypothetical protein QOE12_1860 [Mycobacterium sp.]|nr:hypothetical protein [Mycobacterium sp.]
MPYRIINVLPRGERSASRTLGLERSAGRALGSGNRYASRV